MSYDPFARGPAPVGVRTLAVSDPARGERTLPVEVWYPADVRHRGEDASGGARCDRFRAAPGEAERTQPAVRDAAPADRLSALALFFHGSQGHRRSATELCTHLASHGYVVASPDLVGNTHADRLAALASGLGAADPRLHPLEIAAAHRPLDARRVLERLLGGAASGLRIDAGRIGCLGISLGGWTALGINSIDPRPRATLALAPAWALSGATATLAALLRTDDWSGPVATLLLAADHLWGRAAASSR